MFLILKQVLLTFVKDCSRANDRGNVVDNCWILLHAGVDRCPHDIQHCSGVATGTATRRH